MERFDCPKIQKKICPYELDECILVAEYCSRCNIPKIYAGIRPKVPESHCEAGTRGIPHDNCHVDVDSPAVHMAKTRGYNADEMYEYLMKHSVVFQKLGMDQQGELIIQIKKALDKNDKFK